MTTETLSFQFEEPADDPISDQLLDLLESSLQPEANVSAEAIAKGMAAILPGGTLFILILTCFDIAQQIPYTHVSMPKLVAALDLCLQTPEAYAVSST